MASKKQIALLGDSVLDNFYWLENKERDLRAVVNELLTESEGYICHNFAVDESRLDNVINGIVPNEQYRNARSYPYPVEEDGKVRPLKLIEDLKPDFVFLSVGGNDFRVNITSAIFGAEYFISSVLTMAYRQKFEDLIIHLKQNSKKVVLVSFYTPYLGPKTREGKSNIYGLLAPFRTILRDKWNEFIKHLAKKHKLTIIDLDKMFDPYDRSHYGATEIEPSDLMVEKIAQAIKYVVLKEPRSVKEPHVEPDGEQPGDKERGEQPGDKEQQGSTVERTSTEMQGNES